MRCLWDVGKDEDRGRSTDKRRAETYVPALLFAFF
jgi:hypothetical protein